jgi:hypothetical protein
MKPILDFVRSLLVDTREAKPSLYRDGFVDALNQTEEFILEEMWENGEDE